MTLVLDVQDVTVRFGGLIALDHAILSIGEGELIGFVGPNGAGKTTLMRVITGIVKQDEGSVHLSRRNIDNLSIHERIWAGLALAQQIVQSIGVLTLAQNVALACGSDKTRNPFKAMVSYSKVEEEERAFALLEKVGLQDDANKLPSEVPLGYLKRLEVARALALNPRLLLLDEPLAGLNQYEAGSLADLISELNRDGLSILLIEHNLREVMRICPKIYVQDQGRSLAFGNTKEVMARADVMNAYLGER